MKEKADLVTHGMKVIDMRIAEIETEEQKELLTEVELDEWFEGEGKTDTLNLGA